MEPSRAVQTPRPAAAVASARPVRPLDEERVKDPENVVLDVYTQSRKGRPRSAKNGEAVAVTASALPPSEPVKSEPAKREPAKAEQSANVAKGRLKLDSTPYAIVFLGGQKLGITPIDVELPAATHTLTLRNPEQGLETSYRVTVPAGNSVERRIALE